MTTWPRRSLVRAPSAPPFPAPRHRILQLSFPKTIIPPGRDGELPEDSSVYSVLVIDDDEMHLALMQRVLQDGGYEVYTTADGPQGIEIYKEHPPDLVLLDLGLPSTNGLEVIRKLKAVDPKARIIVITGYPSEESASVAFRYGAIEYMEKPIDIDKLLDNVRSALAKG